VTEKLSEQMLRMAQEGYAAQCGYGSDLREWAGEVAKLEAENAILRKLIEDAEHAGAKAATAAVIQMGNKSVRLEAENAELRRKLDMVREDRNDQYRAAHEAERQLAEARAALADMLAGWRYIRNAYGDLYGVGWDRAEAAAAAAIDAAKEPK
jgi:hypothetical protein